MLPPILLRCRYSKGAHGRDDFANFEYVIELFQASFVPATQHLESDYSYHIQYLEQSGIENGDGRIKNPRDGCASKSFRIDFHCNVSVREETQ